MSAAPKLRVAPATLADLLALPEEERYELLLVNRWAQDGYTEVLSAQRGERVRAEPFAAIEVPIAVFFGDDEE